MANAWPPDEEPVLSETRQMSRSDGKRPDLGVLVTLLALSAAVAGVSAAATIASVGGWYVRLAKPPFNPPNWIFGPVWTLLYIAMAVAAWRVWRSRSRGPVAVALSLYAVQLSLNFAWSILFFGLHRVSLALIDIICLLVALGSTTRAFLKRDAVAGALMTPYLAWVLFAALLNYAIWRLN